MWKTNGESPLVLIAIAFVLLPAPEAKEARYSAGESEKQKKIYTIAVGHDWGAYEYIDEGGVMAGFTHDLIAEVCAAAGIDCRTVWEPYTNCVESLAGQHSHGGEGLMSGWYDACAAWAKSVTRMSFFKFSEAFLKSHYAGFFVRADDNSFDPNNFINNKIGFLDGWLDDENCLARTTSIVIPASNIIHYTNTVELNEALVKGEIDAAHTEEESFKIYTSGSSNPPLKQVGTKRTCASGNGMMSRKDSDFPAVWDTGFGKLVSSGRFKKLCEEAKAVHGADNRGDINCV